MSDKIEDRLKNNGGLGWNPGDDEFDTSKGDYNQHFELLSAPPALTASRQEEPAQQEPARWPTTATTQAPHGDLASVNGH